MAGMEGTQKIADEAVVNLNSASTCMIGGLSFSVIIGILVAIFLTKGITGPVQQGVEFARKLAQGDLTAKLDVDQKDEVGILAQALRDHGRQAARDRDRSAVGFRQRGLGLRRN